MASEGGIALLVIDMQNGFCSDGGSMVPDTTVAAPYRRLVPPIQQLAQQTRSSSRLVIYTRHSYRPGYPELGREVGTRWRNLVERNGLLRDTWDSDVLDELRPKPGDLLVDKTRFDAFLGTDLDLTLRTNGITSLVMTGVSTNVCVESTARTGAQLGYAVTVVSDATSATSLELHQHALNSMAYGFATVVKTEEALIALTQRSGKNTANATSPAV